MKIAIKGVIVLFLLAAIWLLVKEFDGVRFKTESYENTIDSLAVHIDSLHGQNDSLEIAIIDEEYKNKVLIVKSNILKDNIKALKEEQSIDFLFTNEGVYALRNILAEKTIDINR